MANKETLDDIARTPTCAQGLSAEELFPLLAKAELARGALRSHWFTISACDVPTALPEAPDRLLNVKEAAERLGRSRETVLRNAKRYPFTCREGLRVLRFSEKGIEEWIKSLRSGWRIGQPYWWGDRRRRRWE